MVKSMGFYGMGLTLNEKATIQQFTCTINDILIYLKNETVIVELNVFSGRANPVAKMLKHPIHRLLVSNNQWTRSAFPNGKICNYFIRF